MMLLAPLTDCRLSEHSKIFNPQSTHSSLPHLLEMRDIFVEWELTDTLIDGFITSENLSFFSLYPYNAGNTALRVCDWVT